MKRFLSLFALAALLPAACNNSASNTSTAGPPTEQTGPNPYAVMGDKGIIKITSDNTKITFVGSKPSGQKHDGGFKTMTGEIRLFTASPGMEKPAEAPGLVSVLSVEIDADSIFADQAGLTTHLKQDDFFQVKKHPKITFELKKSVAREGKMEDMTLTGDLTIRGTTKSISFPAHAERARGAFYMTADIKINRKDFGMNLAGINDEVPVTVVVGKEPPK